jgi:hypothetical protein
MDVKTMQPRTDALAHLTPPQRQVLQIAANDCPMKRKSLAARLYYLLQAIFDTTPSWMERPLANTTLEALRLFFCLNRRPDPVLMPLVRQELSKAFDERTLDAIAAEACVAHQPAMPRTG